MSSNYSSAFYTNFTVTVTTFLRNGNVSANVAWMVTCTSNQFQKAFSTVYTIPSPGLSDQQVKDGAFESIAGQVLPWSNRVVSQPSLTLGSTGTYDVGVLHVDGATSRVGIGTSDPSNTLQVQGNCDIQGSAYKIGGVNVLTATALGSSITSSSLTTLGTLTSAMNVAQGQSYQINNQAVLSATSLGAGVTGSSLQSLGTLSSLTTAGSVNFNKGAKANVTYTPSSNVFTFGQGDTGGHFQVIGTFVQGVTGTTGQAGNAKFGYRNPGQFVEIGADSPNTAYVDFHSNIATDVDYDTRILSVGGTAPNSGGGALGFYAQNFAFNTLTNRSNPMIETNLNTTYSPGALLPSIFPPRTNFVDEYIFSGQIAANTQTNTWFFPYLTKRDGFYIHYQLQISISNLAESWNAYYGTAFVNAISSSVIFFPAAAVGTSPVITLSSSAQVPTIRFNNNTSNVAYWTIRMQAMTTDL